MRVMVFDTETTGFPLWSEPSEHPGQPHLVQYTGVLFSDQTRQELMFDTMIIRPDGWTIPPELTVIHGISQEQAMDEGVPERNAIDAYRAMAAAAELVSGFSIAFDLRIMRIAMLRCGISKEQAHHLTDRLRTLDLMPSLTKRCKLPPTDKMMRAGRKTFKTPSLAEAIQCVFGEKLDDAHDSRADVLATMRLYLECQAPPVRNIA
jgi:DNA polymerase III subunit epsilon